MSDLKPDWFEWYINNRPLEQNTMSSFLEKDGECSQHPDATKIKNLWFRHTTRIVARACVISWNIVLVNGVSSTRRPLQLVIDDVVESL